jgi:hypothetical protein
MGKAIATSGTNYLSNRMKKMAYKRVKSYYDGIIFGHTHDSVFEERGGVLIANTGSFTLKSDRATHHTGVVETLDGSLEPIQIPMMRRPKNHANKKCVDAFEIQTRHRETRQTANFIKDLWCDHKKQKR